NCTLSPYFPAIIPGLRGAFSNRGDARSWSLVRPRPCSLVLVVLDPRLRAKLAVAAENRFVADKHLGLPQLQNGAKRQEIIFFANSHHAIVKRKRGRLQ